MNFSITLVVAAVYGAMMKLADLTNEHGRRWFYGDNWLFGLGWGAAGSLLMVLGDGATATILLAQLAAYGVRGSLDYWNHRAASLLIVAAFLFFEAHRAPTFRGDVFLAFLIVFALFGGLRDFVGRRPKKNFWYILNEPAWYYVVPTLIYSAATGDWLVFVVFSVYRVSYNAVKLIFKDF